MQSAHTTRVRTFLIADVRGYTAFTQARGDEAAAGLAAAFAEIVREGVEAHGGDVIELRGDEALAVFDSAREAIRAAVELQQTFEHEVAIDPTTPLAVGIGVDAGEAVELEGGFRGGALNLAARLCSRAGPGEVLATRGVAHLARAVDGVVLSDHGTIEAKGIDEPVVVVSASAAAPEQLAERAASPSDIPPELDAVTPIVGRERETRRLGWAWRRARCGAGQAMVVSGPSGIGKTRLAAAGADLPSRDGASVVYRSFAVPGGDLPTVAGSAAYVVLDDLESAPAEVALDALRWAADAASGPVLVIVAFDDERAAPELIAGARRLVGDAGVLRPAPLGSEAVRAIAALYLGGAVDLIPASLLEASGGVPSRVHETVGAWAHGEAARRLGKAASVAAVGRSDLRTVEQELADRVVDLQLVREQARLFGARLEPREPGDAPYRGLASFGSDDAEWFFGRERLVAELVARLAGATMLGVVGPSGSGKSSAVRAGLLPAVTSGVLPGSERWITAVMRPGEHPLRELDRAVWAAMPAPLRERLEGQDLPLRAVRDALGEGERLMLVVDQFEEVFTTCTDEAEQRDFIAALTEAAGDVRAREIVVLALRADFYGRCAADPDLAELVGANHVLVGQMTADEYRRVIEQPALRAGVRVEPALAEELVAEVVGEPGALPLLSTALLELWQRRQGRTLLLASHVASGGVRGAVARLAESAYAELDPDEQAVARAVLLRLAGPGEGTSVVRRRVPLPEFDTDRNPAVAAVLDVLTARRLLTVSEGYVEVAHEALLREWPRFQEWLEQDREGRRLHAHLAESAREWQDRGRETGELYRGTRLAAALDWTTQHTLELNELEREFVAASRVQSQRSVRRLRVGLVGMAILLVVALVGGATAFVQRAAARRSATAALAQSLGADAVSEPQLDRALLLAVEGVKLSDSPLTRADLIATLLRSPRIVGTYYTPSGERPGSEAVSADGKQLAVGEYGSRVLVFSTETRRLLPSPSLGPNEFVNALAYTPDGRLLVLTSDGLHVFSAGTAKPQRTLPLPKGYDDSYCIRCLAATPDGRYAVTTAALTTASGQVNSAVIRWPLAGGVAENVAYPGQPGTMLASPDGGTLLLLNKAGTDALLWDAERMRRVQTVSIPAGAGPSAITNRGATVALTLGTGPIEFLDTRTGSITKPLAGGPPNTIGAAFTPNGRLFLQGGSGGNLAVWNVPSQTLVDTDTGHSDNVQGVAVTSDGSTVYTTSLDGSVIGFDLTARHGLGQPFAGSRSGYGGPFLGVSQDGSQVALPLQNGQVQLLSGPALATSRRFYAFPNHRAIGGVRYSPSGRTVAAIAGATLNGVPLPGASLWDISGPAPRDIGPLSGLRTGADSFISDLRFLPDGRSLVAAAVYGSQQQHGAIGLFDAATGRIMGPTIKLRGTPYGLNLSPDGSRVVVGLGGGRIEVLSLPDLRVLAAPNLDGGPTGANVSAVAYSPSGDAIAVGDTSGKVDLIDAATYRPLQSWVPLIAGYVMSVAFNGDGSLLAVSGTDGTTHLVDVAAWRPIVSPLPSPPDQWTASQFVGNRLFAFSQSGAGEIWPLSLPSLLARACSVAHRNLTAVEWREFLPGHAYQAECPVQ
jgi:WD40 repeat protein/class 3 adenylate cyclase